MVNITFDTLELSRKLESAGFSKDQAAGAARALSDTIGESVVTRDYLDLKLAEMKAETLKWLFGLLLGQAALIGALIKLL